MRRTLHHSNTRGYTLLELLTAMTIVSILAIIALPVYLNYELRAKVSEGMALIPPVILAATEYYNTNSDWPADNAAAGLPAASDHHSQYVDSIAMGTSPAPFGITITYRIPALGSDDTLIYTPTIVSGAITGWDCTQGTVPAKYRPLQCRASG